MASVDVGSFTSKNALSRGNTGSVVSNTWDICCVVPSYETRQKGFEEPLANARLGEGG
jgi:hypothetical protein